MENDWINKGNQFYKKERFEEAINCYDQSIKLDPKNAGVWNNRGLSFDNLNRHQDAIQCYNKALKINPQNFHAWCNLGISFAEMNQSEKALTCFDKALGFNSKHVLSWQKKGDGLRSLGRYEEAIRCYMMAVKLDDNNILAWYNKGLCEDKIGLNAFLSYSNVMMLAMGLDSEFVMDGGRAALEVRHVERVKIKQEYLDHAVKRMSEINRKEPSADNRKKTVNHDASVKGSTSAVAPPQNKALSIPAEKSQKQSGADIHEQNANQWYIKGKQLCDLENYEEAIHCFENALGLEPEYAYAWREKGFCEDNLGRTIDAIHSYKQVLEFAEDDEPGLVQSAIARLAELGRDASLSVNHVKNITSQNPKTNREATYQPGDVIGQEYEVIKVLGSGGFGVVYLVYDRFTKNECALKTMHSRLLADSKIRDLFRKEANVLVELDRHPYLVRTYFVDEFSGILFIAMEYIAPNDQGINSLAGYLKNRQPELQQNLRWAIQICLGMEYAYSKGIRTHRDLKPENIMITQEGTVKITDFGLAGVLDAVMVSSKKLSGGVGIFGKTQGGAVFGTLSHMSPEQFSNAASCDERSDIYSLGIMLFQMESGGELPFLAVPPRDDSSEESIRFGLEMRQLHLETSAPRLNSHLYPIIQRCLEKNPGKRYQSFSKLRSDLEPLLKQINGEVIRIPQLGKLSVQDLCYKGINLSSLERYEDAICFFDKALDIEPNNVGALNDKGKSLNSLGRHEEALHYLDKALEINPLFASAITNKGLSLSQLGRSEEALRYYDKSLEISPQNVASLINKGNYFNGIGRYEDGIVCFNLVLEIDCNDIDAYLGKGRSFYG